MLTDFDATASFDHVLAGLFIATCKCVCLPLVAGNFMYNLLKNMHFHLVTGFGKSAHIFTNTEDSLTGQGVLQGSSSAAPIFLPNSDVSLAAYKQLGTGASFTNPVDGNIVSDHAVQFVDDTSQFLKEQGIKIRLGDEQVESFSLSRTKSNNAQIWSDLLRVSGGQPNLNKCFFYAFTPSINYKMNRITYSKTLLDNDIKVKNRSDGSVHTLQGLSPNKARHTLRVYLSPDGDGSTQIQVSTKKAKENLGKFISGSLSQKEK
jgi:hypothetical protein